MTKRRALREELTDLVDGDEALAQHMIENQLKPQRLAEELRGQGMDVTTAFVDTSPEADGFLVKCYGCQREARLPFDPGGKALLCPACQRSAL